MRQFHCRKDPHGELRGQNVLTRIGGPADGELAGLASELGLEGDAHAALEVCRKALLEMRSRRPRPHLDDKIITAWNGLMISGLCAAAGALGCQSHAEDAVRAAEFARQHLYDEANGILFRSVYTLKVRNVGFD